MEKTFMVETDLSVNGITFFQLYIDKHTKTLGKWVYKHMANKHVRARIEYSCAIHVISKLIDIVHE